MSAVGEGALRGFVELLRGKRVGAARPHDLAERDRRAAGLRLHDPAADRQAFGRRLQQLGRRRERLATYGERCRVHGASRHHRRAGGMRPDSVGNPVGLPVHDRDAAIVDAERRGAYLRHRGRETLTYRSAAGDDLDPTVPVHGNPRAVGGAAAALLEKGGDTGAHQFARVSAPREIGA